MNCKFCKADCVFRGENREKECRGHIPMTNADRIRAMSDEELATFIYTATRACNNYECESCPIGDENCPELDKWLQQPAEEVQHE